MARLSVEPESGDYALAVELGSDFDRVSSAAPQYGAGAWGETLLDDLRDEPVERVRIYITMEAPYGPGTAA